MSSTKQRSRESESESKSRSESRTRASERSEPSSNAWARWVVYLVSTLVTAYAIEFVWGAGNASFAVVMGVATGLAVAVADAIVVYA